jgi:solute carrier family 29 (equilibrative nucleoside transporter), member 1/2/3
MNRVRALFGGPKTVQRYEPIGNEDNEHAQRPPIARHESAAERPFSLLEYSVFLLLGVAMLWAWWVSVVLMRAIN